MGDPSKTFVLSAILEEIKRYDLFEVVKISGEVLLQGLRELEVTITESMVGPGTNDIIIY